MKKLTSFLIYPSDWLENLADAKAVKSWLNSGIISRNEYNAILEKLKTPLYIPNIFVRIGLFLLTLVLIVSLIGLFSFSLFSMDEMGWGIYLITQSVIFYAILEKFIVNGKHHFGSGVDDMLLYYSLVTFSSGIVFIQADIFSDNLPVYLYIMFPLIVSICCALRFTDKLLTAVSFLGLYGMLFFILYEFEDFGMAILPFVVMLISAILYFQIKKIEDIRELKPWKDCITICEVLSLLMFYLGGNYLVVKELSVNLLGSNATADIPLSWLFHATTVIIPLAYFYFGIKRKDILLIRVALLTVGLAVFTLKYYYSLGHPEVTLTLAGAIMLGIAIFVIKYLKEPKFGYTHHQILNSKWGNVDAEAYLISQTMGDTDVPKEEKSEMEFGGGQFGGGGAGGGF